MRKHIFLLMMLFTSLCSYSQYDSARIELNHIFQYIDKSQVPSGYLDEYGAQVVDKNWLSGTLTDSNRIYNLALFRYLYNDLEFSKIYSSATGMTTLENVNAAITAADTSASYTPLVFLTGQYSTLREDAIQQNLFTYSNNQIFDVSNRTQSPYQLQSLFAATPVSYFSPVTNTITLKYLSGLSYSNCGKSISYVWIDFLDGNGYQSLAVNGTLSKAYTDSSGYKQFAVKIQCSDNSVYYCYTGQFVKVVNNSGRYTVLTEIELANPAHTIAAVSGQHEAARIYVRYSTLRNGTPQQGQMVRPLIVVEGYDINDGAPKLDKTNYNINNLIREWDRIVFGNPQQRFTEHLDDDAGYDLVFVDYYTMDFIENNAIMLQKAIEWVNDEKALAGSTEQNVVMGISLGGVLARYTLAKMTKDNGTNSTDTRLLLTHDSPHQGANVPLGLQHFLYDFGEATIVGRKIKDVSVEMQEFYTLNQLPATQELLLYRVTDASGSVSANTFLAGDYRDMITFGTGDPSPSYTFIATSQGSQCANGTMLPGARFFYKDGDVATANFYLFAFKSKYKITAEVKALPSYGSGAQVSYIKMQRNIRLFFGVIGTGWKTTYGPVARTSPSNTIPWETVPGGTQSLSDRSGGSFSDYSTTPDIDISHNTIVGAIWRSAVFLFVNVHSYFDIPFQQDIFTHVPITSALDVQNVTSSTFNQHFIFPLTGLNGSRASDYIAQEQFSGVVNNQSATLFNLNHTDFTARNSEWLFNIMEGFPSNPISCSDECFSSIYKIIGADAVCSSENYHVEFNGTTLTSGLTWSVSSNKPATLTTSGGIATLTKKVNQNGFITLTAAVTTTCGTLNSTKEIQVGSTATVITGPYDAGLDALVDPACIGDEYYFYANETSTVFPATSYTWTLFPPTGNPTLHSGVQPYMVFDEAGTHLMQVTKNTNCGNITSQIEFDVQECLNGFSAYPNPSSGILTIDPNGSDSSSGNNYNRRPVIRMKKSKAEKVVQKVCLYDMTGRLAKLVNVGRAGLIRIDITNLSAGIYVIALYNKNGTVERKKIIVQH